MKEEWQKYQHGIYLSMEGRMEGWKVPLKLIIIVHYSTYWRSRLFLSHVGVSFEKVPRDVDFWLVSFKLDIGTLVSYPLPKCNILCSKRRNMFENICSIPLRSDIFSQAIHPTQPIIAVGLSSGHVETYRLPPFGEAPSPKAPAYSNGINKPSALSGKVRGRRRSLENGFGVVEKLWETRRHKGSCRTLCLSADGELLFSAGTDGIVKAANMETGKVVGKVALPLDGWVCPVDQAWAEANTTLASK
jgi:hypothetical protein